MGFISGVVDKVGGKVQGAASSLTAQNNYRATDYSAPIAQQQQLLADTTGQQQTFANYLQQQAMGTGGPNPAQMQYNENINNLAQQQAGAISSQKGINPALAARMISQQGGAAMQNAAGNAATQQAQNQLNTQGLYGNQLGTMAGQALNSQGQFLGAQTGGQNINAGVTNANSANVNKTTQGIMQGAGQAAMMMSDENVKTGIHPGGGEIRSFLDSVSPQGYQYKDPSMGQGEHVSVMAQDLEKTPIGQSMVVDTPQGKAVDYGKGFGAMLAAQADINARLERLEGPKKMAGGGMVPGQAEVAGDSPQNDTQMIAASPGEVVIPRSIAHDPEKAKKFIQHLNKMDEGKIDSYGHIVKLKAEIAKKQEKLKAMCHGGRV